MKSSSLPSWTALTLLLGSLGQTPLFANMGISNAGAATTYDLAADWSDASNPNGVWTYREGTDALPLVPSWTPLTSPVTQPAWAPSAASGNFLPAWYKARSDLQIPAGLEILTGDVVVHSTDAANGRFSGIANVIWTSPIDGVIDISGAVWMAIDIGRSNTWTLLLNGASLTSGSIFSGDPFNRANPFNFATGSGGAAAVNDLAVSTGDVIELRIVKTSTYGDSVGVKFTITVETPDSDGDGVPDDEDICPGGDDLVDSDGDLVPEFCDPCPHDAQNDADGDGVCADADTCPGGDDGLNADGDALPDACDVCPNDAANDADSDGFCESTDNCPLSANADQADNDGDALGDACDADDDADGIVDFDDNCGLVANPDQADFDGDDAGDACDTDDDGDGVPDNIDQCPMSLGGSAVNAAGCAIDQLCPCVNNWKNHGAYVSCVARTSEGFVAAGLLTGAQKDAIVAAAGASSCGQRR